MYLNIIHKVVVAQRYQVAHFSSFAFLNFHVRDIYISLVNEQIHKTLHLRHLFTLPGCNFWLKLQKLLILFLIERSICQLSESVEKIDFWVNIKKLFCFKWNWIFNFYENYFSFGSNFASRLWKLLKNSLKWLSTSNQLESKFFL